MIFTQIRNATVKIDVDGMVFLIDPLLAPKEAYEGFEGTLNSHIRWPRTELPFSIDEILQTDAVILTHLHPDHFDEYAIKLIPKNKDIFCQNQQDKEILENLGFENIEILNENTYKGVKLIKTKGLHGSKETLNKAKEILGEVCGVIFISKNGKKLYLVGDSVYNEFVENEIKTHNPDYIVVNSCDAKLADNSSIIMSKEDVLKVNKTAKNATIIASHMGAINHLSLTRDELRNFAKKEKFELLIPEDGESLNL